MNDVFKYAKQLEKAGFSREQAEIQLQVFSEIVEGELATKQDLKILETGVEGRFNNLENKILQAEYRLTIKLGSLLVLGFTAMATLMKFWLAH
jgi:hypothetical protein